MLKRVPFSSSCYPKRKTVKDKVNTPKKVAPWRKQLF